LDDLKALLSKKNLRVTLRMKVEIEQKVLGALWQSGDLERIN
jgi:hypothetical protein